MKYELFSNTVYHHEAIFNHFWSGITEFSHIESLGLERHGPIDAVAVNLNVTPIWAMTGVDLCHGINLKSFVFVTNYPNENRLGKVFNVKL
jgi:hypothetical protein